MADIDIPDGTYRARAVEAILTTTRQDKPCVVVTFEFLDQAWKDVRMQWRGYFTDKTTDRTLESLRYCGWKGDDVTKLDGVDECEVDLVVAREKDLKGRWMPRVQWVNKPGMAAAGAPMPPDRAAAFAAAMRGAAAASRMRAAQSGPAAAQDDAAFPFGANKK